MSATKARQRRGITVLVVMVLVSLALAMSFAVLRSQSTSVQLQQNQARTHSARQAAVAGLAVGIRAMRLNTWGGVTSTLSNTLSDRESYIVTYEPGDASLTPDSPDYAEYPRRVTVKSLGTCTDPAHPGVVTTYEAQVVMKLIPRALSAAPTNWSNMVNYTVYQLTAGDVNLAVPCHVEGPARLRGAVDLASPYYWGTSKRNRYLGDLNAMISGISEVQQLTRLLAVGGTFTLTFSGSTTANIPYNATSTTVQTALQNLSSIGSGNVTVTSGGTGIWIVSFGGTLACQNVAQMSVNSAGLWGLGASVSCGTAQQGVAGTPDYRPLTGPISMPTLSTNAENLGLLTNQLALTLNNSSSTAMTAPTISNATTYRLYSGGPSYAAATLPGTLTNATLTSDPVTNPLGIFYTSGNLTVGSNVTVTGTLAAGGTIQVNGTNVQILPLDLTPVEGTTTPVNLPGIIAASDLRIGSGANLTVNGLVYVGDDFQVDPGTENTAVAITGNVLVGEDFTIGTRNEWNAYIGTQWDTFYAVFTSQLSQANGIPFFPQFMAATTSRSYVPRLNFLPNNNPPVRQWHNMSNPLYVAGSGDSGLHWDLVSWTDNP